jgi:hypothetical protein
MTSLREPKVYIRLTYSLQYVPGREKVSSLMNLGTVKPLVLMRIVGGRDCDDEKNTHGLLFNERIMTANALI